MKKLRIAFMLLFALTCSIGLFACTKAPTETLDRITVEGQKTEFTEADTEFTTGDTFKVIGHFKTDDPEKATRELTAEEITIEAETMDAAFQAIKDKDFDSARGTYTITVRGKVGNEQRSTTYNVTLDHAWGDPVDGVYTCPLDGAEKETKTINDSIAVAAWGSAPVIGEGAEVKMASDGSNYMTYGTISQGQSLSISGTGYTTGADTWDTPVLGIRKGENLFLAREDTWVIGADGKWNGCSWTIHPSGNPAVEYTFESTDAFLAAAEDWEVYYTGAGSRSEWGSEASPVSFTITWDYDKLGFVLISTVINGGTPIQRYIKVPSSTYETALYMEDVTMTVTSVSQVRNLVLDAKDGFTLDQRPTKTVYAENTMIELDADSNIVGAVATGHYNGNSDNPVDIVISTYDIYADMDVESTVTGEDGSTQTVTQTVTYNLRNEQLQAGMKNFRIAFGGYEVPIDVTVVPSSIKSVTANYNFGAGTANKALIFENAGISLDYDVNASGKISVSVTGTVSMLTESQKEALNTTKNYYIAVRIIGDASEVLGDATCSIEDAEVWLDANGINLIIPVGSTADLETATVTIPSSVTASTEVELDLSMVTIPAINGVVVSNASTLDLGGDVVVNYYGISEGDLANYSFAIGSVAKTWAQVQEGTTTANIRMTGAYAGGVLTITYALPAINLATQSNINLSYLVSVLDANRTSYSVRIAYNMVMSEAAEGFYKVNDTTYLTTSGSAFVVITIEDSRTLAGTGAITLNLQNDGGEMFDLAFTATDSGITFVTSNTATIAATTTLALDGTIGNNTDGDRAALYITRIPLATFGLTLADGYYVELEGANEGTTYNLLHFTNDGIATVQVEAVESDTISKTDIAGTCLVDGLAFYTYDGFNFARQAEDTAFGQHNYVDGVCSLCGTKKYGAETTLDMTIGAVANAATTGFSISFIVEGNKADWGSAVINPINNAGAASGMIITLPNLDPFANTEGFAATNMYPTAAGAILYPGFAYNIFQSAVTKGTIVATITVSPTMGISYYLNGEIAITYPVTATLTDNSSSVLSFVQIVLNLVEKNGFKFASGADFGEKAKDLIVYPAALNEGQVAAEYAMNYQGASYEQYRGIAGELGSMSSLPTVFADWINVAAIQKGTTVTFYGTQVGEIAKNWEALLFEFTDNAWWTQRTDNYGWSFGVGFAVPTDENKIVSITDGEGNAVEGDFWAAYKAIAVDCTWSLTITFSAEGTVMATLVLTGANGNVYTNTTTWTFVGETPDYIGLHFTAENAWVKVLYSVTKAAE